MSATLAVIGFGTMGSAIVRGACAAGALDPRTLLVIEPDEGRRAQAAALGCRAVATLLEELVAENLLLAVKPQMWLEAARDLGTLAHDTIVISIMAGILSERIREKLGHRARVIRVMPNTPCRLGEGISAMAPGAGTLAGDEAFARRIFSALGCVVDVDESMLNAVTALSGSGPAYVFLLAEAMEQAGVQMGLDWRTARALAYQTIRGAGGLLTENDEIVADQLRSAVTSPGGTTAAALEVLFERELPQIIAEAIIVARDRGEELDG